MGDLAPPTSNQTNSPARFQRFWRDKGDNPRRKKLTTASELTAWSGHDLDILITPLDGRYADSQDEYDTLIKLYSIPGQFILERERSVTHSLGRQIDDDGSETLWMHFMSEVPSTDPTNKQPHWLKWAFILTWKPATAPGGSATYKVTLIAFEPPVETLKQLVDILRSPNWTDVTVDPYMLVNLALGSWHERIDKVAWEVNDMVRAEEEDVFRRARTVRSTKTTSISDLDLHRIHTSAKYAIFMVEALDAVTRSVDLALSGHSDSLHAHAKNNNVRCWENTHRRLQHTSELFHSTKLRTASAQARMKNTIDLAFHINTVHDSQVSIDNSQSVRIISIVGLVFIPFSAVSSIFGTQFFSDSAGAGSHMRVSPDFWILWVIALPLTFVIIGLWRWNEYRDGHGRSPYDDDDYARFSHVCFGWLWGLRSGSGGGSRRKVVEKDVGGIV
ncbi:hypothetical protein QBC43DRAFT_117290 [Cladorrhinum sp. PSN259]|nr:hypothetical protein QBC43DRAFT_117290 [Cladorrhinum sp. PSN259]